MGRRRLGPVQLNSGDTWYVRLTIPPALRQKAGKTRLIRSLGTTSHSIALSRYGAAYTELEKELQILVNGPVFRDRITQGEEDLSMVMEGHETTPPLSPLEATEIQLGSFDPSNPLHLHVFNYYKQGIEIPISWDEAVDLWVEVKTRESTRPPAPRSIEKAKSYCSEFSPYAQPSEITFDILDKFVSDQEKSIEPGSVKSKLKMVSAVLTVLVKKRKIPHNIVKDYSYVVGKTSNKRAYTDDEFRLIASKHHPCLMLALTGMRPGELEHGVREGDVLIIRDREDVKWRPKTLSAYRRVPLPPGFKQPTNSAKRWAEALRKLIEDKNVTPHSGRHTFIEVARRAGADMSIVEEICGHGSTTGSTSQKGYGAFPDEVLKRESQKIWDYINKNILDS